MCSHEDNGNSHAGLFKLILKIQTVDAWQPDIKHQATGNARTLRLEELLGRLEDFRTQPDRGQKSVNRVADGCVIVNDENH